MREEITSERHKELINSDLINFCFSFVAARNWIYFSLHLTRSSPHFFFAVVIRLLPKHNSPRQWKSLKMSAQEFCKRSERRKKRNQNKTQKRWSEMERKICWSAEWAKSEMFFFWRMKMKETKFWFKSGRFYVSFLRASNERKRVNGMCLCVLKDDDDEKKLFLDPASSDSSSSIG